MKAPVNPFSFDVTAIAGRMRRHQEEVIAYLVEENRVLREQIGNRRLNFNDDQRRRFAAKARKLGRKRLEQVATIAAPETLLRWHYKLIVQGESATGCRLRAGLQLLGKLLLWLCAWQKKIALGAIAGYREQWPTWATIWHTIRYGTS